MKVSHLPTLLLLIGYPAYWLQLALHPSAHASWLAAGLFVCLTLFLVRRDQSRTGSILDAFASLTVIQKVGLGAKTAFFCGLCAFLDRLGWAISREVHVLHRNAVVPFWIFKWVSLSRG